MYRHPNPPNEDARLTALICEHGHIVTERLEEYPSPPAHCEHCGAPTTWKCASCGSRIMGSWPNVIDVTRHPPPSNCTSCGKPYPWRVAAIARANRVTRMQVELHQLDQRTVEQLEDFTQLVVEGRATPQEAETFGKLFKKKAGLEAAKAVGGVLKDIATGVISDIIRKTMMLP
jgi:hypothetical protein